MPVYGDGMQIRDWLHVSDDCSDIDTVLHKGTSGEVYNIGGNNEKANIEIVKLIIETLGKSVSALSNDMTHWEQMKVYEKHLAMAYRV